MYILICRKTERTEPTVDAVNNTTEANGEWRLSGSREKEASLRTVALSDWT